MTPAAAELLIHRRVRALAAVRSPAPGPVEVSIALNPSDTARGQWCASAYGTTAAGNVVKVAAHDPDPTAALLALPGALAAEIEQQITDLRHGLREGADLPEEDEPPAVVAVPALRPRRAPRRPPDALDDARVVDVACGLCSGEKAHRPGCPRETAR